MTPSLNLFFDLLGASASIILAYMVCWFMLATLTRRNDLADIAWGIGFAVIAWFGAFTLGSSASGTTIAVVTVVTLWALRLALHISIRAFKKGEDPRYAQWRAQWGAWVIPRSFFQIFILQGVLLLCVASPILVAVVDNNPFTYITAAGIVVWIIGFVFEAGGDYQLARFISNKENKGKIMTTGLWSYTRHPNYFGEVAQWWGVFIAILPSTLWFIGLIGPLTITLLILKVSGIPMLEQRYDTNSEYQEYKKRTNAFFPWFPRV